MKVITLVIPVYQNEGELHNTYNSILEKFKTDLSSYDYQFIFVEDGSRDNSFNELLEIRNQDSKVTVIKLSRNFGQFSAINAGVHHATGEMVVVISADLQEPPELIVQFVREYENGHDVIIGERAGRHDNFIKNLTSRLYFRLMRVSNPLIPVGGFDCYLLSKKAYEAYKQLRDKIRIHHYDIVWLGFKVKFIQYVRRKREIGKSQYTFNKQLKGALNGIMNSSIWPIRLMSILGIIVSLLGFIYASMIVYGFFFKERPPQGFAPIMITLLMIGGMIMFMLGVIGEYIWRIYYESKGRPLYLIDEVFEDKTEQND